MADLAQEYPLENQWGLLVEHRIEYFFHGLWVESGNVDEVSALLRVDPDSRQECSLETATEAFQTSSGEMVWMGAHSAGWTHILARGLYPYHPAIRNLGKRRVLEIRYNDLLKELEPVNLYYDGEQVGDVTPPYEEGGDMDLPDYRPYASGIALGDPLDLSSTFRGGRSSSIAAAISRSSPAARTLSSRIALSDLVTLRRMRSAVCSPSSSSSSAAAAAARTVCAPIDPRLASTMS